METEKKFRVIVADDDEPSRELVAKILLQANIGLTDNEIGKVSNGEELCQLVSEHPVELVVSDCHMPGKNGDDAIAEIKALYPSIRTILMTGKPWEVRKRPPEETPDLMLVKPFRLVEFFDSVQRLLHQAA